MVIEFQVDPEQELQRAVTDALKKVRDLTVPFTLIAKSWFRSNHAIFALNGPGKYEDLSPQYKKSKQRDLGFVYPILRRQGTLEAALTQEGASGSIVDIAPTSLGLGVDNEVIPYAGFLADGTSKMPARPFIFLGAEQTAPSELNRRKQNWIDTIQSYVFQASEQVGSGVAS